MLRISKIVDYGILVLTHMAARPTHVCSAADLAASLGLGQPVVSKVLKLLAQHRLVASTRGAHGGYRLSRPPEDISLIAIVEAMEGPLAMTECSLDDTSCGIASQCGARANWRRINDIVADALRNVSLAQMLEGHPPPDSEAGAQRRIPARLATA